MPSYPGTVNATVSVPSNLSPLALGKGETAYLFGTLKSSASQLPVNDGNVQGETPNLLTASIAVHLLAQDGGPPPMLTVEGFFSGAPGTFEIDLQEADTDADAFYILPTASAYTVNAVNATTFAFRVDLSPTGGKFFRAFLKARANNVSLILKVTRLA